MSNALSTPEKAHQTPMCVQFVLAIASISPSRKDDEGQGTREEVIFGEVCNRKEGRDGGDIISFLVIVNLS